MKTAPGMIAKTLLLCCLLLSELSALPIHHEGQVQSEHTSGDADEPSGVQSGDPASQNDDPVTDIARPSNESDDPVTDIGGPSNESDDPVTDIAGPANESDDPVTDIGGPAVDSDTAVTQSSYPAMAQGFVQDGDPNAFIGAGDPASMAGMGEPMPGQSGGFQIPDYVDYGKMDEFDKKMMRGQCPFVDCMMLDLLLPCPHSLRTPTYFTTFNGEECKGCMQCENKAAPDEENVLPAVPSKHTQPLDEPETYENNVNGVDEEIVVGQTDEASTNEESSSTVDSELSLSEEDVDREANENTQDITGHGDQPETYENNEAMNDGEQLKSSSVENNPMEGTEEVSDDSDDSDDNDDNDDNDDSAAADDHVQLQAELDSPKTSDPVEGHSSSVESSHDIKTSTHSDLDDQ